MCTCTIDSSTTLLHALLHLCRIALRRRCSICTIRRCTHYAPSHTFTVSHTYVHIHTANEELVLGTAAALAATPNVYASHIHTHIPYSRIRTYVKVPHYVQHGQVYICLHTHTHTLQDYNELVVLETAVALAATPDVSASHSVPFLMSADMRKAGLVWPPVTSS